MRDGFRPRASGRGRSSLSPEWSLLIACARDAAGIPGSDDRSPQPPPRAPIDWDLLLRLAEHHGLTLLLNRFLGRAAVEVPASVLERLRTRARVRARDNLRLTAALLDLATTLEGEGIPVLAYKGPVLSVQLFGDPALRDYDDLDLLVRERDVEPATRFLERRGLKPWFEVPGDRERRLADSQYARHFGDPRSRLAVDLHWGFSQPYLSFALEEDRIWERTETVTVGGAPIRTLPEPLLLLVLCVHGSKHEPSPWNRLKWIVDVAALVRGVAAEDWQAALRHARALRLERPLLFGLLVAHRLLDAPLAPAVRDGLFRAAGLDRLAEAALATLVAPDGIPTGSSRLDYDLRLLDRQRDRLRYVLHRLFVPNPKDWASLELPAGLAAAYYLLRPLRLARAALSRVARPS